MSQELILKLAEIKTLEKLSREASELLDANANLKTLKQIEQDIKTANSQK